MAGCLCSYCPEGGRLYHHLSTFESNTERGDAGYLELAVQKSPENPPAVWLWRPEPEILNAELKVRVGGSFVWPPATIPLGSLRKVILVAGGVGINPLMSVLSSLADGPAPGLEVHMLYSIKDPGTKRAADKILFLERIATIFTRDKVRGSFKLFLTPGENEALSGEQSGMLSCNEVEVPFTQRRISVDDVKAAIGEERRASVVYVCGLPTMTDSFVQDLTDSAGYSLKANQVLFEKMVVIRYMIIDRVHLCSPLRSRNRETRSLY